MVAIGVKEIDQSEDTVVGWPEDIDTFSLPMRKSG
jgi:hypothetical protein